MSLKDSTSKEPSHQNPNEVAGAAERKLQELEREESPPSLHVTCSTTVSGVRYTRLGTQDWKQGMRAYNL